jgi:outer membrane protein
MTHVTTLNKMNMRFSFSKISLFPLLFLLLGVVTSSTAQEKLSLQEAITIALQNNYDIKLVSNDVQIARNNANIGNAGLLPRVDATFSEGGG